MGEGDIWTLVVVFFATSVVSVVTGSTSLITVPVMIQLGISPQSSVATNMLALTLMSMGSSYAFRGSGAIDRSRLPLLVGVTLAGSLLGALLLLAIPAQAVSGIVSVLVVSVAVASIFVRDDASRGPHERTPGREGVGWVVTFVLAIYGGFFSGGYVTFLTAAFVALFRMTFLEAVATTKVVNIFSSAIATVVFALRGFVDIRLGLVLGAVMFVGGMVGARVATRIDGVWLRRLFVGVAFVLAIKTLVESLAGASTP